jgi:hypothetical protein
MTGDGCACPRIASVAAWRPPTSCEGSAIGALLYAGRWPARYTPGGGPCAIHVLPRNSTPSVKLLFRLRIWITYLDYVFGLRV